MNFALSIYHVRCGIPRIPQKYHTGLIEREWRARGRYGASKMRIIVLLYASNPKFLHCGYNVPSRPDLLALVFSISGTFPCNSTSPFPNTDKIRSASLRSICLISNSAASALVVRHARALSVFYVFPFASGVACHVHLFLEHSKILSASHTYTSGCRPSVCSVYLSITMDMSYTIISIVATSFRTLQQKSNHTFFCGYHRPICARFIL